MQKTHKYEYEYSGSKEFSQADTLKPEKVSVLLMIVLGYENSN